jgi:hypothetical protein
MFFPRPCHSGHSSAWLVGHREQSRVRSADGRSLQRSIRRCRRRPAGSWCIAKVVRRVPATVSTIVDGLRWAEEILREIERRWPIRKCTRYLLHRPYKHRPLELVAINKRVRSPDKRSGIERCRHRRSCVPLATNKESELLRLRCADPTRERLLESERRPESILTKAEREWVPYKNQLGIDRHGKAKTSWIEFCRG